MNRKLCRNSWYGNGPTVKDAAKLGIRIVNNSKETDLAAFDLLPRSVRDVVNYSPIVHWSAVQMMVFWNKLADERPDLSVDERTAITINLINEKNYQTIILANNNRKLYIEPLGFTQIKKKNNVVETYSQSKTI